MVCWIISNCSRRSCPPCPLWAREWEICFRLTRVVSELCFLSTWPALSGGFLLRLLNVSYCQIQIISVKFCLQLPPGAVPIFAGGHEDQLKVAIARSQKHAASADDIAGNTAQVRLWHLVAALLIIAMAFVLMTTVWRWHYLFVSFCCYNVTKVIMKAGRLQMDKPLRLGMHIVKMQDDFWLLDCLTVISNFSSYVSTVRKINWYEEICESSWMTVFGPGISFAVAIVSECNILAV